MRTACQSVCSVLLSNNEYIVDVNLVKDNNIRMVKTLVDTGAMATLFPYIFVEGAVTVSDTAISIFGANWNQPFTAYTALVPKLIISDITLLNRQVLVTPDPNVRLPLLGMDILSGLSLLQHSDSDTLLLGGPKEDFHVKNTIVDSVLMDCLESMNQRNLFTKVKSVLPNAIDMNYKEFRSLVLKAIENI